jgi:hypothetical protein
MLLVHMTWTNAAELLATGVLFGLGWAVGQWIHGKTIGRV